MKTFTQLIEEIYQPISLIEQFNLIPLEEWVLRDTHTDLDKKPVKVFDTGHSKEREIEARGGSDPDHVQKLMKSAALHARKMKNGAPTEPAIYYSIKPDGSKQGIVAHFDKDRRPGSGDDPEQRHMYVLTTLPKNKVTPNDRKTKVIKVPYHPQETPVQ